MDWRTESISSFLWLNARGRTANAPLHIIMVNSSSRWFARQYCIVETETLQAHIDVDICISKPGTNCKSCWILKNLEGSGKLLCFKFVSIYNPILPKPWMTGPLANPGDLIGPIKFPVRKSQVLPKLAEGNKSVPRQNLTCHNGTRFNWWWFARGAGDLWKS